MEILRDSSMLPHGPGKEGYPWQEESTCRPGAEGDLGGNQKKVDHRPVLGFYPK